MGQWIMNCEQSHYYYSDEYHWKSTYFYGSYCASGSTCGCSSMANNANYWYTSSYAACTNITDGGDPIASITYNGSGGGAAGIVIGVLCCVGFCALVAFMVMRNNAK